MTAPGVTGGPVDVLGQAVPIPEAGCFLWAGAVNHRGYGRVYSSRRMWQAHRLSWTQVNGPIPDGMFICHKCDTPSCVNPEHLFVGTPRDNAVDMALKGRHHESKATHCKRGHSLDGINNRGERYCNTCKRASAREWKRRAALARCGGAK